jgi:hypothetical protein
VEGGRAAGLAGGYFRKWIYEDFTFGWNEFIETFSFQVSLNSTYIQAPKFRGRGVKILEKCFGLV